MLDSFEEKLENINGFETDFVKILSYNLMPGYSDMYKSYNYIRFCTIIEGRKQLTIGDQVLNYNKNQSLLLPAHSKVYMDIEVPTKALVFELNNELILNVLEKTADNIDKSTLLDNNDLLLNNLDIHIHDSVLRLVNSSKDQNILDPFIIDLYAQKLIYDLLRKPETGKRLINQASSPMEKAIQYMKQNINNSFPIMELAQLMNMSVSNLSHSFKDYTGISPKKYMHALKMIRAKEILLTMSVTETAFELGYETPSYFIHVFKNQFGFTPKKFQQSA